ncbi:MAG: hypothetical protein HN644_08810, partial [Rhodospirillales bacterium]|nr:hypothetical protein [Rhodospirillales bacterium]
AAFRSVPGVMNTSVGFMGDSLCCATVPSSDKEAAGLCMVEVVQIDFDADQISYAQLLDTFWNCHDAARTTHLPEDGRPSVERSVLFVSNDEQRKVAETERDVVNQSARFSTAVTTTIESVGHFHRADEAEQRYFERNDGAVCSAKSVVADTEAAE